ncbi:MAG: tetratricopeptide repeat protein [Bacteroidales bacterium]|nr:tetratricopeptide repeat protein [Bacteroidales bacterium]
MKKFLLTITILLSAASIASAQYDKDVFMWRGRQALSDGRYALAIENFNVLARLDTTDYWSFFFRGIAKYNLGDLRGAQTDFNTSVRLNPVFTNGFHYRAITESRFGDYEAAFRDFNRALELRPGQIGIYFSRGVANFLAQKFDDAVADFDFYIKREPRDPAAFLNRGACYLFLADTTKAMADYNRAIRLDRTEPEGFVRRARVYAAQGQYDEAVADLDTVLEHEPGNALTLYNRSLIYAQVGAFEEALADMDRVININPGNVLAHYNRAAIFVEMARWQDALEDYNKAIELYPDFAKAYLNRSYVENMLGRTRESRADYQTAQQKVRDYRSRSGETSFADTTRQYNSLLALDADFAKKDFDNELLQHRDIDIRLRPLYKFSLARERENRNVALSRQYENVLIDRFIDAAPTPITLGNTESTGTDEYLFTANAEEYFVKGLQELQRKQFNSALSWFDRAVNAAEDDVSRDRYARYYKAFYLMNRGVLKAEMIDFIASLEGSVQTLSMDTEGSTRARVSDRVARTYDYSDAIADIKEALSILPDVPYLYFDLGNLECLSSHFIEALENYDMAIKLYPNMGDAYYNRGLVLIYLKDKEKGCIDLSRAGELGVADSYSVISKYCAEDETN